VLLLAARFGVLATLGVRRQGWPFASLTAFALSREGSVVLLLSDLAEHTRNVLADPRASLLVQDSSARADPQAGARVTLLGTIAPVAASDRPAARALYVARHPQAEDYFSLADFRLYALQVDEARQIAGFANAGWLTAKDLENALKA
jgi:putative heme iron utilization protein